MSARWFPLVASAAISCLAAGGCGGPVGSSWDEAVSRHVPAPERAEPAPGRGLLAAWDQLVSPRGRPSGAKVRSDAVEEIPHWLELGEALAADGAAPATRPAPGAFVPWRKRRGPAYPDDKYRSVLRDFVEMPAVVWDDTKATFTDPIAWVLFGMAGGAGIAISSTNSDARVADHYTKNGGALGRTLDEIGEIGGNPGVHFAVAGAMYFAGLLREDTKTYEVSKTLVSALAVNGLVTLALKGLVHTTSPNGDEHGWPSGHTSSSFCLATVLHRAYGPLVGIPLFAFASFVGYERVDARNHDFSDVVSGALIGIAIGYTIGKNHDARIFGFDVVPYANPARGQFGVALSRQW